MRFGLTLTLTHFPIRATEFPMLDIVYLVGGCLFFAVSVAYATACDKL